MGIAGSLVRFMLLEHERRALSGRVLTLGRQGVWLDRSRLEALFQEAGVGIAEIDDATWDRPSRARDLPPGMVSDEALFAALGFDELEALDVSDYEGADWVHDLNRPVPEALHDRFDFILDGGTLEHVFDQRMAFENVVRMLAPGGRVCHAAPTSNYVDHGFFSLNPTVFLDFYAANGLAIERIHLFEHTLAHDSDAWTLYEYPFEPDRYSFGGLGTGNLWGTLVVASKGPASTWDRIPSQGDHLRLLAGAEGAEGAEAAEWGGAGFRAGEASERLRARYSERAQALATSGPDPGRSAGGWLARLRAVVGRREPERAVPLRVVGRL